MNNTFCPFCFIRLPRDNLRKHLEDSDHPKMISMKCHHPMLMFPFIGQKCFASVDDKADECIIFSWYTYYEDDLVFRFLANSIMADRRLSLSIGSTSHPEQAVLALEAHTLPESLQTESPYNKPLQIPVDLVSGDNIIFELDVLPEE